MWFNKINYGTYTGTTNVDLPSLSFHDRDAKKMNIENFRNQIVVLDVWTTGCGVCFNKFPILQKKYDKYKKDSRIRFYALNNPLKRDSKGLAIKMIDSLGYTFGKLYAYNDVSKTLSLNGYPTVLLF